MTIHAFRLLPGSDLKQGIEDYITTHHLSAATLLCCVGSLQKASLRLADEHIQDFPGPFEIVSVTGTLSTQGIHIHLSISDAQGETRGGHLKHGCIIHTTAEITLLEHQNIIFERVPDATTGFRELIIKPII